MTLQDREGRQETLVLLVLLELQDFMVWLVGLATSDHLALVDRQDHLDRPVQGRRQFQGYPGVRDAVDIPEHLDPWGVKVISSLSVICSK